MEDKNNEQKSKKLNTIRTNTIMIRRAQKTNTKKEQQYRSHGNKGDTNRDDPNNKPEPKLGNRIPKMICKNATMRTKQKRKPDARPI